MFGSLQEKFESVFRDLKGQGRITEKNIQDALREVRVALLDADVNLRVVRRFVADVKERALGQDVLQSLSPGQQFIKIVNDELTALMGATHSRLALQSKPPTIVMMCGLQGSGKTTTCGKLAASFRKENRRILLVAADVYRPAAVEQLRTVADQVEVDVYAPGTERSPVEICREGVEEGRRLGCDLVVLDTAGRLHLDDLLMQELVDIRDSVQPHEILFVADAMTGQEAVNVAQAFDERLDISGVVLTKMDSDARGGAALSIRAVMGKPIKYVGMGEKMDALEPFHPDRIASRILGMGDVLSLVERAEQVYDQDSAKDLERKIRKNEFTLTDFRDQMLQIKRMGPLDSLLRMVPGLGSALGDAEVGDEQFKPVIAMIDSMTPREREKPELINASRRRRIARGAGKTVQDVNRLLKQFSQMRKMMRKFSGPGGKQNARKLQQQMMRGGGAPGGGMLPGLGGPPGPGRGRRR